ncbi:MAG: hypothetical protein AABW57_02175, partial [Nanoarchaeota archaeon]
LTSSSSVDDYKKVTDLFFDVIKKYPSTTYSATAYTFVYGQIYSTKNLDKDKQQVIQNYIGNYIGGILKDMGLSLNIAKEQTTESENSKSYYRKAVEDYKNVVNYKGQITVDKDKALDAQRKIAEIYDYYLNEADNAIEAYQSLINNYDISELEKITYESRIEFLRNAANYNTQPIDIYEDGNLIKVILSGVERTEAKPIAFISLNDKDATGFKEGSSITSNWKIESIESNKVNLVSNQTISKQQLKQQISIDKTTNLDNVKIKLVRIDSKKEARITIKPVLKGLTSVSNFQVHIPIERRLIKLSDEQIDNQVQIARNWINKLNTAIDRVDKIYRWLSYYCYTIFIALFVKNFVQGFGGRNLARQQVIVEWKNYCGEKDFDNCIFKDASAFDNDISKMTDAVQRTDKAFDIIKKAKINKQCDSISTGSLNTDFKDLNEINNNILKQYCNLVRLDSGNEVINEGEIRSTLLQREKATLKWDKETEFKSKGIDELNIAKFIDQDNNLRNEAKFDEVGQELRNKFIDNKKEIKDFNS